MYFIVYLAEIQHYFKSTEDGILLEHHSVICYLLWTKIVYVLLIRS